MENASKALIIAGAILLAILIISLGIMIFNQAQDAMGNGGMSDAEITAFNNKFIKYEGNMKGSTIKNLIQEVNVNNKQDTDNGITMTIHAKDATSTVTGTAVSGTTYFTYPTVDIIGTHTYKVTVNTDGDGGRVGSITVDY